MKLVIQLRQANIKPETSTLRSQLVWFLVNHAEVFDDRIEFSGPDHCGSVSIIDGDFALPTATLVKYADAASKYDFLTIHDAANALNWPPQLRIATPDMHDEQPAHETEVDWLTHIIDAINASTAGLVAEIWYGTNVPDAIHIHSTAKRLHFVWGTCNECWGADVFVNDEAWNKSECDDIGIDTTLSSDIYTPDVVAKTIIEATLARIGKEKPFTERVIESAVLISRNEGMSAQVNFTEPDHAGRMEIMGFRPPFYFVFDYDDEAAAAKGGKWRARVWLKPAEDNITNPAYYTDIITPKDTSAEALAEACGAWMKSFRIKPAHVGRMTAKLYNCDNYPSLEAAIADKGWVGNTTEVSGFSNILDTLENMKAAAEVTGSDDYVSIRMRVEVGPSGNYIELPDCKLDNAVPEFEGVFQ